MKNILALLVVLLTTTVISQETRTIGFYNLENLFDTIDGSNDDADFLPTGKLNWNSEKYLTKLKNLNQVIDEMHCPLIIGLCELENKEVVEDLIKTSEKRKGFGVVHYDSEDDRGVDVALMYDKNTLTLNNSGFIRYKLTDPAHPNTRDIVWGKFTIGKDTILALVNHWPSRRGGEKESEPNRIIAASAAHSFIDSVMKNSPAVKIVFMGDLNDYPTNLAPKLIAELLVPQITKASGQFGGSYSYRSEWDVLDHIMVSPNFSKGKNAQLVKNSGKILSPDFIITEYKGEKVPKRNYAGDKYLEGYSDHLPVVISIKTK